MLIKFIMFNDKFSLQDQYYLHMKKKMSLMHKIMNFMQ